ncbi:unnamed protein product [Paramecium pentaurelia]|uniref:ABC transporter domain-containing protein n=1 Tax=Paramecium pentaurelia TaxID=43138 RepID=A0A8S1X445_9CILI|nr:unnamed protein product [Paramecium pentaurelia]
MTTIWQQTTVVFHKNLSIYYQEKQFRQEFFVAFLIFIILLVGQETQSPTLLQVGAEFLPMTLLISSRYIVTAMISEKSDRQKEIQKIMGLKQSAYQLGWFLFNISRIMAVSIFFLVLAVPTKCFGPENMNVTIDSDQITINFFSPIKQIGSYLLFALGLTAQQYFLTTLFDQPKNGADLSMLLNIFGSISSELLNIPYFQNNSWIVILLGVVFPTFLFDIYPYNQILGTINRGVKPPIGPNLYFCLQGAEILFYGILYLYLEQVLPNEYGTNKHPLFFIGKKYQIQGEDIQIQYELANISKPFIGAKQSEIQEDNSSAIYHEVFDNPQQVKRAIIIKNVKKSFNDLMAVNGVTLQIYESQILCLLGHNGAGKTTLISILTGLIKRDSGAIVYYGTDTDFDVIRNYLGFCPQKDTLYDSLNCDQHLSYYGRIKGIDEKELQLEIDQIINKCDLSNDRMKLAKQLSGGTRRKLSLAISLIGQSKVIFLDEPTSGMDPISRQKIWDILTQVKNEGRCLVLTTHHLDEAEILSERLAIMAKGKLLTVGSVDFIKMNFGIGYHLSLYDKTNNPQVWSEKSKKIANIVQQIIPQAKISSQTSQDSMGFQVPFKQKDKFLSLFEQLERDQTIQVNLMMNTLEEAFINIGMDEESFLDKASGKQITNEDSKINIDITEEFNKIIPPECLSRPPQYNFGLQLWACFIKKHYTMTPKRYLMCIFMPSLFAVLAPIVSKIVYNANIEQIEDEGNQNTTLFYGKVALIDIYIYILIGASMASSQIGSAPVEEREKKQKYALNVMGCRTLPYWLGYYFYDITICIIVLVIFIIAVNICDLQVINNGNVYGLVFCCYLAYLPLGYTLSWLFTQFLSAVRSLILIQLFGFFMIASVIYVVSLNVEAVLWILSLLFPSLALFSGFITVYNKIADDNSDGTENTETLFQNVYPFVFMIIMIFQACFYFFITYLIDNRELLGANSGGVLSVNQDEDVIQEERRVEIQSCQDRVIARKISKTYANGFQAVKGTSFGIEPGQIFGLLGPNGAGKSTTFNMITSKLKPSTGTILLQNQEVKKGLGDVYQNVGICPQFDSLYDIVNVRRHLQIWAYLKGLRGEDVNLTIEYFMKVMQLTAYENTLASQLSGGNKRKLCVALALMGGTNMQFFDEPSSGVDPIARRFLWNAIQQGVKLRQSSVILTTHTMDEAESLCNKIAIQVNGRFACIGSVQHLRSKFGDGYRVLIEPTNNLDNGEAIIQEITKHFGNIYIMNDMHTGKIICKFPQIGFQFHQTFYFFQEKLQKEQKLIKDFQISQPNLEQIFMQFAAQQVIEPEVLKKESQNRCHVVALCGNDEDD